MDNFQELLKEIKQDGLGRRKDSARTNELLEQLVVSFRGFKKPKENNQSLINDKPFSLKEDFEKFKGELRDSFLFVKKGIMGTAPSGIGSAGLEDGANVRNTPAELMADESEKQTQTINELLNTTTESLSTLKKIGFILEGSSEQLKLDQEDNKTQKEVLKELQKLNEVTAENVAAGGGIGIDLGIGGGKPAVGLPEGPDKKNTKQGAKGLGKSLLKKIPVVGAVAGLAFGASRLMQGDTVGAGMEVASGLAGTIPAVGTAASVSIDAALAAKDAGIFDKKEAPAAPPPPPPKLAKAEIKKASGGVSSIKAEENLEQLQMAQGELQGIYKDYRDEKAKVSEKLAGDRKNYPEGFIDDPSDPEYPKELKAIDDKYKKIIDAKKKEVEQLSKAPGISEAKARQAKAEADEQDDDKEISPAKTKSKVTGEKTKTTTDTTVTGGGSTTTKMVLSKDAQKAEAESPEMSKRHQAEYTELRGKLEAEGKLEGKSRREIMNMPEIKELRARQNEEENTRGKRVTEGMSYEVSKTSSENATMRDEMSSIKSGQTAIMNNVSNNSQTTYVPIKGEPRPGSRGSALDKYNDRVATY